MFEYPPVIAAALTNPRELLNQLDSFWRDRTSPDTNGLVLYESYAQLLGALNNETLAQHFLLLQTVPLQQSFWRVPFWPLVIPQNQLQNLSFYLYGQEKPGGGFYIYDTPPELLYGEQGAARYVMPGPVSLVEIGMLIDSITNTKVVIDSSQFSFDRVTGRITFLVDPFTLVEAKTFASSGESYIVLWMRNARFELFAPYDWTGWVVKFYQNTELNYAEALKAIWELVILGPSLERVQQGLLSAAGLPFATQDGIVQGVDVGAWQSSVITDNAAYSAVGVTPIVSEGDQVHEGDPLMTGIEFFEYVGVMAATATQIPGLIFTVPLSTGAIVEISAQNVDTEWSYDVGRPSPWRFPLGGYTPDVEQFWVDVDTYATANGIDFAVIYGLSLPGPNPVNPLKRIVQDLIQANLYVTSVDLETLPTSPGGFLDRARQLLPPSTWIVLLQRLPAIADDIDLGAETSDDVGYGYHDDIPTEVISVSGTDLTFFDYVPLVVIS